MAKDAVEAAPNVYTILFENERVRLLEGRVKSGESSTMHSHPAGITYILAAAKRRSTRPPESTSRLSSRPAHTTGRT
jgi:beta-alanine degradation protein BauB